MCEMKATQDIQINESLLLQKGSAAGCDLGYLIKK